MLMTIVGIILFIVIAVILFLVIKKILKVVFILIGIIILVFVVGGYFVYSDAKDLQENFETSENLFLFGDENIISGFQTIPEDEPLLLDIAGLEYVNDYYPDNLKEIKGDNYKLIIFKKQAFDSIEQIEFDDKQYTSDFVFVLINSETPIDDYLDNYVIMEGVPQEQRETAKQSIKQDFEFTDEEFKGMLFSSVFSKAIDEEGPIFIFKEYKEGNVIIYKETAVFKMIDLIPTSFIKNIFADTTSAVKEKIKKTI